MRAVKNRILKKDDKGMETIRDTIGSEAVATPQTEYTSEHEKKKTNCFKKERSYISLMHFLLLLEFTLDVKTLFRGCVVSWSQ